VVFVVGMYIFNRSNQFTETATKSLQKAQEEVAPATSSSVPRSKINKGTYL